MNDLLFAVWFLLPAALANAAPIFAAAIPIFKKYDQPIDNNKMWRGRQLLGPHKTWRGLIAGILVATATLWVQQQLFIHTSWGPHIAGSVDYASLPILLLGPLFALGALGGDAVESFFKRQKGIASGQSWVPFDQIDYVVGAVIVSLFFVILSPLHYVLILFVWFVAHLVVSFIGYKVGLKEAPI